jgi:hypothetical protein
MPTSDKSLRMEQQRRRRKEDAQERGAAPEAPQEPLSLPSPKKDARMALDATQPIYWVRFSIPGLGYFTYHGTNYDRGQLMPLAGGPRDEQLVRMGYIELALKEEAYLQAQCGACGLWFLNEQFRDGHGRLRHRERFVEEDLAIGGGMEGPDGGAALRDVTGDAEEKRMQQQYPLYLDKTKATLESSRA